MLSMSEQSKAALHARFHDAELDVAAFLRNYQGCELCTCKAQCCYTGTVLQDGEEKIITDLMKQHAAPLKEWLPKLPKVPFEEVDLLGTTNHACTMTKVRPYNYKRALPEHFDSTRCVFADSEGKCGLQRLSLQQKQHPWWYKPLDCWLHPIRLVADPKPMITIPTEENDPYKTEGYPGYTAFTPCGAVAKSGKPGYEVLSQELAALGTLLKRDLIAEIKAHIA